MIKGKTLVNQKEIVKEAQTVKRRTEEDKNRVKETRNRKRIKNKRRGKIVLAKAEADKSSVKRKIEDNKRKNVQTQSKISKKR